MLYGKLLALELNRFNFMAGERKFAPKYVKCCIARYIAKYIFLRSKGIAVEVQNVRYQSSGGGRRPGIKKKYQRDEN